MPSPFDTLKSFVGLNQPDLPPTTSTTSPADTDSTAPTSTIEPTSHPVEGNKQKTELQASAPAVIPAKLAGVSEIEPANDEIAIAADAEAGVALNEVMPIRRGS